MKRWLAGIGVVAITVLTGAVGAASGSLAAQADPYVTESAITKVGTGRFADLSVTVGKTEDS